MAQNRSSLSLMAFVGLTSVSLETDTLSAASLLLIFCNWASRSFSLERTDLTSWIRAGREAELSGAWEDSVLDSWTDCAFFIVSQCLQ